MSSISYRVFAPSSFSRLPLSAYLELEKELKSQGSIVYQDFGGRTLWQFHLVSKTGDQEGQPTPGLIRDDIGSSFVLVQDGQLEPVQLQRGRMQTQTAKPTAGTDLPHSTTANVQPHGTKQLGSNHDLNGSNIIGTESTTENIPYTTAWIYKQFVAALLAVIVPSFANIVGAIPLDHQTVLLPQSCSAFFEFDHTAQSRPALTGTFEIILTTNGGLLVGLGLSTCRGLATMTDLSTVQPMTLAPDRVLAAPFGIFADLGITSHGEMATTDLIQQPGSHTAKLRAWTTAVQSASWGRSCLELFEVHELLTAGPKLGRWTQLILPKRQPSEPPRGQFIPSNTPWPRALCFRRQAIRVPPSSSCGDGTLSLLAESHDPLGEAKSWFGLDTGRKEQVAGRRAERAVLLPKEAGDSRLPKVVGNQWPSVPTAAANIYPTPPDALQNPNGVTPSFDGNAASPSNPLHPVSMLGGTDLAAGPAQSAEENKSDPYDFVETRHDRNDSHPLSVDDNMFEDMGGDMFGENDITEDDFSFFDERPDVTGLETQTAKLVNSNTLKQAEFRFKPPRVSPVSKMVEPPSQNRPDDSIVFAKPELKHARSSQATLVPTRLPQAVMIPLKREASPFDPHTVFKRVRTFASLDGSPNTSPHSPNAGRKPRVFEKVDFSPLLPMIDKKYQHGGPYDFNRATRLESLETSQVQLSQMDFLKRSIASRSNRSPRMTPNRMAQGEPGIEYAQSQLGSVNLGNWLVSDGDDSSVDSDREDSSQTSNGSTPPSRPVPRFINQQDDDAVSQATSMKETEVYGESITCTLEEVSHLSQLRISETPLRKTLSDPAPDYGDLTLTDDELVHVAQILTEQASTNSLDTFSIGRVDGSSYCIMEEARLWATQARSLMAAFRDATLEMFKSTSTNHLKRLIEIQDAPVAGQATRLQPRPIPGRDVAAEPIRPNSLYQLPSPHLEVRRGDLKLSILPSAIAFWESLGLAPSSGSKEISAICVCPSWRGMAANAGVFLDSIKSVYESLKLGTFEQSWGGADDFLGVVTYEIDRVANSLDSRGAGLGSTIAECLEQIRQRIEEQEISNTNIVVYFVCTPSRPQSVVEACVAFRNFVSSYQKSLGTKREQVNNSVILQLIPAELISCPTALVVTPATSLINLCMETYDRCVPSNGLAPAPAIKLEQSLPRMIDFKLTSSPSASLMHENSTIHVAYAQSMDQRWVTAAWTDDRGQQQTTASYCLGRTVNSLSTSMNDVAHEIWETTLELISTWKVHWRIVITKCAPMEQHEIEFWAGLARTESKATITMLLMTVDTAPSLQLIPPAIKFAATTSNLATTPVSTPQASIVSPEQSHTPATPMRESANPLGANAAADSIVDTETDTTLVDATEQVWGAVLAHRLSNTVSMLEISPCLASGYLIKKTGVCVEDTPIMMEVNLVFTEATLRAHELLLREMLSSFRSLGTLARARNIIDGRRDVRPWHIAAAEKAVRALYLFM